MNLAHLISYIIIVAIMYIAVFSSIPYSWFVDITDYKFSDACVGDNTVRVYSERTPRYAISGGSWGQVVRFEDQLQIETTIFRALANGDAATADNLAPFGYEPHTTSSTYYISFTEPFAKPGVYGVNEWVTINPLPLISKPKFNSAANATFTVNNCE